MTVWVKLHLIVEGDTELTFARDTLKPHLAQSQVSVNPFKLPTNPKGAAGGALSWDRFHYNVSRLLKQHSAPSDRLTTLLDWYRLDPHFPGFEKARQVRLPRQRVEAVEQAVGQFFDSPRLLSFFMLHEFEALLFCDLSQLSARLPGQERAVATLQTEVGSAPPEDINEGAETHPSARLEKRLPGYHRAKVRVGAPAAGSIGLQVLREKCPHFGQWLTRLENLTRPS